jgi:molybdopterin synthase sulfur carrier subunit
LLGLGTWDFFGIWDLELGILEMVRIILPHHLRTLAKVGDEVHVNLNGTATVKSLLDALEERYPMLRGTIREHGTLQRRPMVRFFACGEDISHESPDTPLPDAIAKGAEPFFIMGAIAGG